MMDNELIGGTLGTSICGVSIALSTSEVQSIVSIICTILGLLITITTTIIVPFVKSIIKAKEDGKITIDEVEDITDELKDNIDKIKGDK